MAELEALLAASQVTSGEAALATANFCSVQPLEASDDDDDSDRDTASSVHSAHGELEEAPLPAPPPVALLSARRRSSIITFDGGMFGGGPPAVAPSAGSRTLQSNTGMSSQRPREATQDGSAFFSSTSSVAALRATSFRGASFTNGAPGGGGAAAARAALGAKSFTESRSGASFRRRGSSTDVGGAAAAGLHGGGRGMQQLQAQSGALPYLGERSGGGGSGVGSPGLMSPVQSGASDLMLTRADLQSGGGAEGGGGGGSGSGTKSKGRFMSMLKGMFAPNGADHSPRPPTTDSSRAAVVRHASMEHPPVTEPLRAAAVRHASLEHPYVTDPDHDPYHDTDAERPSSGPAPPALPPQPRSLSRSFTAARRASHTHSAWPAGAAPGQPTSPLGGHQPHPPPLAHAQSMQPAARRQLYKAATMTGYTASRVATAAPTAVPVAATAVPIDAAMYAAGVTGIATATGRAHSMSARRTSPWQAGPGPCAAISAAQLAAALPELGASERHSRCGVEVSGGGAAVPVVEAYTAARGGGGGRPGGASLPQLGPVAGSGQAVPAAVAARAR